MAISDSQPAWGVYAGLRSHYRLLGSLTALSPSAICCRGQLLVPQYERIPS